MRVHVLAKEFGVKATEFVDIIQGFGIKITSHLSGLDTAQVADIRHKMILKKEAKKESSVTSSMNVGVEDLDVKELNPLGNLTQEEVDKVMVETNDQGETPQEFNARRREEIITEKKKIEEREKLSSVVTQAKENKQEQYLKLERAGLWGWIKGLFS